jgi:retinol dehydrogenase-12
MASYWCESSTPRFNVEKDIPDLAGKTIIVTGGNSGLGLSAIELLAKHNPSHIYLGARSATKAAAAIEQVKAAVPTANITFLEMDLGNLASVKKAAETFSSSASRLDILMQNAGVMALPAGLTSDGYEIQFGTNHVGHFLFTKSLMPILQKTAAEPGSDVRIVNLSSIGHKLCPTNGIVFDQLKTDMASTSTWTRYGQSKLANILFTKELAKRHPNIISVAIHPGGVYTNLSGGFQKDHPILAKPVDWILSKINVPASEGAWGQVWAATTLDKKTLKSGEYYGPVAKANTTSVYAQDEALAAKLWEWTDKELADKGF